MNEVITGKREGIRRGNNRQFSLNSELCNMYKLFSENQSNMKVNLCETLTFIDKHLKICVFTGFLTSAVNCINSGYQQRNPENDVVFAQFVRRTLSNIAFDSVTKEISEQRA